jgi:hypothetical protein
MKSLSMINLLKNLRIVPIAVILLFLFNSCATKEAFVTSDVVPAARGLVTVKNDKNNNYVIKIEITNLAEPGRLQSSGDNYVAWLVTDNNETRNIGQITSSESFLTKKLKASLETVSPAKPTRIFITTEDDPNSQYPTSQIVMSTENF